MNSIADTVKNTHRRFSIDPYKWYVVVDNCKAHFKDTDCMQPFTLRPWVTNTSHELFIRNDLATDSFVTYLGLIKDYKRG